MLITLGEALNQAIQTDGTIEDGLPDARQIFGMRNRLVHGYDTVRSGIVWDVADRHIPTLVHNPLILLGTAPDPGA